MKNILKIFTIIFTFANFINLYLVSFIKGGGWDLNEQIAFSHRMMEGISSYANGQTDLFFPSSPYFPGVAFLSFIFSKSGVVDIYTNEFLMLATAVTIGLVYFIQLNKLTLKIYPNLSKSIVFIFLSVLFATQFRVYMSYVIEFKPDTILLVIGLSSLFLLESENKPNLKTLVFVGLMLFAAVFFKQTFFIIYFLVFTLILFNGLFSLREKIILILSYSFIGLIALALIFSIDNAYYFTVESMQKHAMLDFKTILWFFSTSIISNIFFCIFLIYFLVKRHREFSLHTLESKYLIFAFFWLIFALISTSKLGGNNGNVEVGLIVFAPFVINGFDEIFRKLYSKSFFNYSVIAVLTVGISVNSYKIYNRSNALVIEIENDKKSIDFLSRQFKNKNTFVDGDTYTLAKAAGLKIITATETAGHFNNIPNYDMSRLKNAIEGKVYDLIFIDSDLSYFRDKEILKKVEENYSVYRNINMPPILVEKLLIKKELE